MLATFGLRLACGMAGAMVILPAGAINPRFFRTHFLTILGLLALVAVSLAGTGSLWVWLGLAAALALCFLGSFVWSLDGAPLGKTAIALTALATLATLIAASLERPTPVSPVDDSLAERPVPGAGLRVADDVSSAALLGAAMTAMLMGHSYLVAPTMSLTPLLRLLAALVASIGLRLGLAAFGLWSWLDYQHGWHLDDVALLWLPLRWGLAFVGPLVLGWMAWQAARIRSTQSATGILYVVVIFCFLGELTSQLLRQTTGFVL